MTLQSAIEAELPFFRAQAEARMTSTCTIRRKSGATALVNGLKQAVWDDVHTDLRCRVGGQSDRLIRSGDLPLEVSTRRLHLPAATTDLRDGDLVEITSGECAGLVFRIIEADFRDQATARRLPVVAAERPTEWA